MSDWRADRKRINARAVSETGEIVACILIAALTGGAFAAGCASNAPVALTLIAGAGLIAVVVVAVDVLQFLGIIK